MLKPADIVTDQQVIHVHANANFGNMTPRQVVDDGVVKSALCYSHGSTQLAILREHGLVRKGRGYYAPLTAKGVKYLRAMFPHENIVDRLLQMRGEH